MSGKTLLFAALSAGAVAIALASVAFAHTRPIRFDPAPGAVLDAAPDEVSGWFTNPLRRDPNWTFIHVTDAEGNRVDTGEPTLSEDRRQMTVQLQDGLGPGIYIANWYAWDEEDGHILGDCFTFFVGQEAADAAVADNIRLDGGRDCQRIDISAREGTPSPAQLTPTPEPEPGAGTDGGADSDDDDGGVPVWALVVGIALGAVAGGIGGRFLAPRG